MCKVEHAAIVKVHLLDFNWDGFLQAYGSKASSHKAAEQTKAIQNL